MLSILSRYNVIALSTTTSTKIRQGIANQRQTLNGGINVGWTKSPLSTSEVSRCFAALVFFLFFSSVVTTSDSPCYMPCQDKSTIQLKSSVLSVDVWRVLSPGGPIFNSVSSDVFPFGFFVSFRAANNGTDKLVDPQPPQNGCAVNYKDVTCVDMWSHEKEKTTAREKNAVFFVSGPFTTWLSGCI